MLKLTHQIHSFDEFTLDLTRGCLLRGQEEIKLRPKSFEVLKYLVKNNGRLISKDELIHAVWVDTAVTDDSLVQCLKDIRHALRDEAQQIIKTVHGRGYIFDAEVKDNGSAAQVTTYTEETAGVQVIIEEEETNGHGVIGVPDLPASRSAGLLPAHRATSIESLTTAIKQHKWSAVLGVLTLAVVAAAIVYFTRPGEAIDSIAVLPLVNVGGDPNTDYLSDGLSESIIDSLSQLPSLKTVIARSSVMRYKGREIDPKQVGQELGVRAVLTGRFMQRGDDLAISVELVDVRDNKHLWGTQYNRKLADITAVPMEIAQDISEKLRLRLSGEEKKRLSKRYTDNGEAYRLYLMGHYYGYTRGLGLQKSIELFEQAIKTDPNYAPAYAGLSQTYCTLGDMGLLPPKEAQQKQEWAALKAMEIDDMLAEAHVVMGLVRRLDSNWSASEEEGKRAVELDPNSWRAHMIYAYHLTWVGRLDEAMPHMKRALELDPLSSMASADLGHMFYLSRQYDRAIEQFQKIIQIDPHFAEAHSRLGMNYVEKGMYEEAIAEHKKAIALDDISRRTALLGHAYAVAGRKAEAQKILDDLKELAKHRYVSPFDFALIYMGLGDKDQAFVWLEKTFEERRNILWDIKLGPRFDSLRSDPRFADLLRRLKLAS